GRVLDADRDTTGDLCLCPAQMLPKWYASFFCFEIPIGVFNCRLSHAVTAHRSHQRKRLRSAIDILAQHHRSKKFMDGTPGRVSPLIAVKRTFAGGTFAPALRSITVGQTHQHYTSLCGASETCFKEMD